MGSVASSGSQTATLTTEHTLTTQTPSTGGALYQLRVDAFNLANGETLVLKLKTMPRTGDTSRALYTTVFTHAQGDPIKDSPAVYVPASADLVATLTQTGGTGRAYPWALYRLDG
jgi:Cu/Zn superoxide dismutase